MEEFKELQNFVDEMKATSSLNKKKEIIKKYSGNQFIKDVLFYSYNPFYQFHITSKSCKKNSDLRGAIISVNIFNLLDDLRHKKISGHDAITQVNSTVEYYDEYVDLIYSIIDKDLELRANASVINKVIPKLIPTFDVALANKYEAGLVDFDSGQWFASRKLDGLRCIVIVDKDGKAKAFSRKGKEFFTLKRVLESIEALDLVDMVFDGEICIVDSNGDEDFTAIQKEYKKKDHTIQNPRYKIFDCLTTDEFDNQVSDRLLIDRRQFLCGLSIDSPFLDRLEMQVIHSEADFSEWADKVKKGGWEGFMVRKNVGYKGKRSKDLLKVKTFHDAEYVVKDVQMDDMRIIQDGKEVVEKMLSNVLIEHRGHTVSVGSGFSHDQRRHYFKNPGELLGAEITVQYFEETTNSKGTVSLRFPTVKAIYENGRDA